MQSPQDGAQRGQPRRRAAQRAAEGPVLCPGHPSPSHVTPPGGFVSCMAGDEGAAPTRGQGGPGRPPEGTHLGSDIRDSCSSKRRRLPREHHPHWCLACALKGRPSQAHVHTDRPVLPALQKGCFSVSIL